jgi:hypothetical protein
MPVKPVKPATTERLWVPLRQANWAASGAAGALAA